VTKAPAFCRYWSCPRHCSATCKPAAGSRTGTMSTRRLRRCTRGTPHVRWRSDDPGPGLYNDS
jgi:hypothetical protein